jgi:hypothetical protein
MSGALRGRFAQGLPISSEVRQREHGPAHLFDKVAVRIESYLYPMKVLLFMTVAQAGSHWPPKIPVHWLRIRGNCTPIESPPGVREVRI